MHLRIQILSLVWVLESNKPHASWPFKINEAADQKV